MSKDLGTLPQAARFLALFTEQKLTTAQIERTLLLFPIVSRALVRDCLPELDDFRIQLNAPPIYGSIEVEYTLVRKMLGTMRCGQLKFVDSGILQRFEIKGDGAVSFETALCDFSGFTVSQALRLIARMDPRNPWALADIGHLLTFEEKYPALQCVYDIFAVGSQLPLKSETCMPALSSTPNGELCIRPTYFAEGRLYDDNARLLAVRQRGPGPL